MTASPPRPRTRRRPDPLVGPPRLFLAIADRLYEVRRVGCAPAVGDRAFRLLSDAGDLYDVVQHSHGPSCDCPDFVFRRDGLDPRGCKHVRALVGCGLLEPATRREPGATIRALAGAGGPR